MLESEEQVQDLKHNGDVGRAEEADRHVEMEARERIKIKVSVTEKMVASSSSKQSALLPATNMNISMGLAMNQSLKSSPSKLFFLTSKFFLSFPSFCLHLACCSQFAVSITVSRHS